MSLGKLHSRMISDVASLTGNGDGQINFHLDGGGSDISAGSQHYIRIPFDATIAGWQVAANTTGNLVIDLWRSAFLDFPPTVLDSITGADKPTLTSEQTNENLTLTEWDISLYKNDYLLLNVDSVSGIGSADVNIIILK